MHRALSRALFPRSPDQPDRFGKQLDQALPTSALGALQLRLLAATRLASHESLEGAELALGEAARA